jgi:ribulose-bisphosphate carboxylase large chain
LRDCKSRGSVGILIPRRKRAACASLATKPAFMSSSLYAVYHVRSDAASIEQRSRAIAVEQSVEMPVTAIDDDFVLTEIVGRVDSIEEREPGVFAVRVALAVVSIGHDAGQLINMLFGNTSLQDDVVLHDVEFPGALLEFFGGPRNGLSELRRRVGAGRRALTCSALKPQGLPAAKLAQLAGRFADGGIDYIKDDHGLADQAFSPFAKRVEAISAALQRDGRDGRTRYAPNLSGDLDSMRLQIGQAANAGIDTVLIAPMIAGLANFHKLVRENPGVAFIAHPSMGGATRIAPALLLGKLFRLLGADAVVFPHYGGRFGYSLHKCRHIARAALEEFDGIRRTVPVPAGGMTRERVAEMLDFYGADVMLLIGGALLEAREQLTQATSEFVKAVQGYSYD